MLYLYGFGRFANAYFGEMLVIEKSVKCCEKFADMFEKQTKQKYLKNDRYIYRKLLEHGNEDKAVQIAKHQYKNYGNDEKSKPSDMYSTCTVYQLIEDIKNRIYGIK